MDYFYSNSYNIIDTFTCNRVILQGGISTFTQVKDWNTSSATVVWKLLVFGTYIHIITL